MTRWSSSDSSPAAAGGDDVALALGDEYVLDQPLDPVRRVLEEVVAELGVRRESLDERARRAVVGNGPVGRGEPTTRSSRHGSTGKAVCPTPSQMIADRIVERGGELGGVAPRCRRIELGPDDEDRLGDVDRVDQRKRSASGIPSHSQTPSTCPKSAQ